MSRRRLLLVSLALLALGIGAFLLGRQGTAAPPSPAETPRPIAWLREASGSVLVGGSSGGLASASRTAMHGRDQLATDDGRAVLDLRQSGTLVVGGKTALQVLPEEWDGARLKATRVRVMRGTLRGDASSDVDGLRVELGDQAVEISPGGSAFFAWGDDGVAVSMQKAGGMIHGRDGRDLVLPAGQGARLTRSGPPALAALPAALDIHGAVSPKVVAHGGKAHPTFRFAGQKGTVNVVVARDQGLTQVVAEATDKAEAVHLEEGLDPGSYFWSAARVDAVSRLKGPYAPSQPLPVASGGTAVDEVPLGPVVIAGAMTRVFFSGAEPPELSLDWVGLTDEAGYQLLVAADARFSRPVLKRVTEESRLELGAMKPGSYWWRVKVAGGKPQTGAFLVKRVSAARARDPRTSRVPDGVTQSTVIFQREPPAIAFEWPLDPRASRYRLLVFRDKAMTGAPFLTRETTEGSLTVEPGLLPEGEVGWHVERLKADGSVYYPGRPHLLSLRYDLENPNLELSEPVEGATPAGNQVLVSGLAPRESALWVNGAPVAPDRRGHFSITVPVDPRKMLVVVKTARGGKDFSYYVRSLHKP